MQWRVTVDGEATELSALVRDSEFPDCTFEKADDGTLYLTSDRFERLSDQTEVLAEARNLVDMVNGALAVDWKGASPIRITGVYFVGDDGSVSAYVFPAAVQSLARAIGPTVSVEGSPPPGPSPHHRSIGAGLDDPNVSEALGIFGRDRSWFGLSKVKEIIVDNVEGRLKDYEGVSGKKLGRFDHTANHQLAAGADARHARLHSDPPKNPMPHDEAVVLIQAALSGWIDDEARPA